MFALKVCAAKTAGTIAVNEDVMAHLNVQAGDTVYLTQAPGGGYRLTIGNPTFERQMTLAEHVMKEDRGILHTLSRR